MTTTTRIIYSLIIIMVAAALMGLAGWYLFLRIRTQNNAVQNGSRGLGTLAPSFFGAVGNTFSNILTSVGGASSVDTNTTGGTPPELWHISLNPVAGMAFVNTEEGERLYFVDRASGNVLSANIHTGVIERLTNTLMPKIYEAAFSSDGAVIERSIDENGRATFFTGVVVPPSVPGDSDASSSLGSLQGRYFENSIGSFAVDPLAREVVYLSGSGTGTIVGITRAWDGTAKKELFRTSLFGWHLFWLTDGRIIISQHAADDVPGYAYEVGKGGILKPLVENVPGLVLLPRAFSDTVLYSTSQDGSLALYAQKGKKQPISIPLKTLAEKCVWTPAAAPTPQDAQEGSLLAYCAVPQKLALGEILNNWYRGRYHTADAWWKVDAGAGTAESLVESSETIDVTDPIINSDGTAIAFIDNSDRSLWVLRIPQNHSNQSVQQ